MKKMIKRLAKFYMMLVIAAVLAIVPIAASATNGSSNVSKNQDSQTNTFLTKYAVPSKASKPPANGSYIGTTMNTAGEMIFNPTGTLTGNGVDTSVGYIGNQLGLAYGNAIVQNTIPKNEKAAKLIAALNNKRRNLEKVLTTARNGSKQYNTTARAIERNITKVGNNTMVTVSGTRRAAYVKGLSKGAQYLGTLFNGISIYSDINTLNNGNYTHKHPSMIFVSDALLSASIAASSFAMTPMGKNPIVQTGAFITGIVKDLVTSETFGNVMNSQNNYIIQGADSAITMMNGIVTSPTATYVPEYLIGKWYQYMGYSPSDETLANLDNIHKQWLNYQQTSAYRDKLSNLGLGRKPGDGVGVYKPNLYLYPLKPSEVSVIFRMPGLLETVIPDYPGEWRVNAMPDGTLMTADGNRYGYLFYESLTWPFLYQTTEGWVLKSETRREQLWSVMKLYGFNDVETADFVTYWTTKLDTGADYAMYPQMTDTVDEAMPLTISPTPDNLFRLWFAFEKNGSPDNNPIVKQIDRSGFSAVEWGGVILPDCE